MAATSARPRTATELASAQARDAWERGWAAMGRGDFEGARSWFARACRLAPSDVTPKVSQAGACMAAKRFDEAAALFEAVSREVDARIVWVGLAAACARLGRMDEAAEAMGRALSRHAMAAENFGLAESVARAAGFFGWCGVGEEGRVVGAAAGKVRWRVVASHVAVPPSASFLASFSASSASSSPSSARRLARGAREDSRGWSAFADHGDFAGALKASTGGRALLGSPIDLAAIRRVEGLVEPDQGGGISGWAWHPGDPGREPVLTLVAGAARRPLHPTDRAVAAPHALMQPRGFRLGPEDLTGLAEPIRVVDARGADLMGSPLSPRALAAETPTPVDAPAVARPAASLCPARPVAVVVPAYRGLAETRACLGDVLSGGHTLIVVDDATPEPALAVLLDRLAAAGRIKLLRHERNRGFPAAANAGLRAALALDVAHDVVLLNSDTRLAPGWAAGLRAAVHGAGDIGTATPLSNDGSIASFPNRDGGNPAPVGAALAAIAREAARAASGGTVDVPTGVGFCLYVRRECLAATGLLREDCFAQGYGEENDFCLRASRLGWRHVIAPGVYVAHFGGRSFGAAREGLLARNMKVLERLHPGYRATIQAWHADDAMAPARRALDVRRWAAAARREARPSVLIVTHDDGGGVERCVRARVEELTAARRRPIVLRPVLNRADTGPRTLPGRVRIDEPDFPNLMFALPGDYEALLAGLRQWRPEFLEIHHLLGHEHGVVGLAAALGVPYEMRLHDYAAFCPRITLTAAENRYCGEPDVAGCVACVAAHGAALAEPIAPAPLRARSAADFAGARRIVVPSHDMAMRMRRHFPGRDFEIEPHEPDPTGRPVAPGEGVRRVLVVGAIGAAKGFDVLLACARDAAARDLALRFVVVGRTIDDEALFATGRADITGPYREGEAAGLIAEQRACIGFVPSIWPETWCFALGEMFSAGLPAAAFDIGAPAERIRRTGRGWLLPLGAPSGVVNRMLLTPPPLAASANVMQTVHNRVL